MRDLLPEPARCRLLTLYGTACGKEATCAFGEIPLCPQHWNILWRAVHIEVRNDADSRRILRAAVSEVEREIGREAREKAEQDRRNRSVVYFVERDGWVKIGVTQNLGARLRTLSRGGSMPPGMTVGPVRLLGTTPGRAESEKHLHHRFDHLRVWGEWFALEDELRSFIAGLACNRTESRTEACA